MNRPAEILASRAALGAAALCAAAFAGCVDIHDPNMAGAPYGGSQVDVGSYSAPVSVSTRFVLEGLDEIEDARLDALFVNVGAVFLDPADDDGVTLSNREPFQLEFDIANGETDISGPDLHLPFRGDFFVGIQVEPPARAGDGADKDERDQSSLILGGSYDVATPVRIASDEPSPLPWEPKATERFVVHAVPFTYRSDAAARLQVGEIDLGENGRYELIVTLRLADWVTDDVLPKVMLRNDTGLAMERLEEEPDDDGTYDQEGMGLLSLVGDIGVGTRRF